MHFSLWTFAEQMPLNGIAIESVGSFDNAIITVAIKKSRFGWLFFWFLSLDLLDHSKKSRTNCVKFVHSKSFSIYEIHFFSFRSICVLFSALVWNMKFEIITRVCILHEHILKEKKMISDKKKIDILRTHEIPVCVCVIIISLCYLCVYCHSHVCAFGLCAPVCVCCVCVCVCLCMSISHNRLVAGDLKCRMSNGKESEKKHTLAAQMCRV